MARYQSKHFLRQHVTMKMYCLNWGANLGDYQDENFEDGYANLLIYVVCTRDQFNSFTKKYFQKICYHNRKSLN